MTEELTGAELAKRWGISRQSVGHRAKEPGFPLKQGPKGPLFPWPEVNDWWMDRAVQRAIGESGDRSLVEAERRKAFADAELAEIKRDTARGKLVRIERWEAQWTGACSRVRSKLVSLPNRVPKSARAETERAVEEMLAELRDQDVPEDFEDEE